MTRPAPLHGFHLPADASHAPAFLGGPEAPLVGLCESGGENGKDLIAAALLGFGDGGLAVRIRAGDDARDPDRARAVAMELCEAGVDAVIGHFGSTTALPASRVYGAAGVPFLAPGTSAPHLCADTAPTTLQLFGTDTEQVACLRDAGAGRPALIVGELRNCGASLAESLFLQLTGACRQARVIYLPRGREAVPPGALAGVDVVYVLGSSEFAAAICRLPALAIPGLPVLLSDDSFSPDLFEIGLFRTGRDLAASVAFLDETGDVLVDRSAAAIRRRAGAVLGRAPGPYFDTSYIAARALAAVWHTNSPRDRAAVLASLRSRSWQSPYGVLSFDARGRLTGHRWAMVPAAALLARARRAAMPELEDA